MIKDKRFYLHFVSYGLEAFSVNVGSVNKQAPLVRFYIFWHVTPGGLVNNYLISRDRVALIFKGLTDKNFLFLGCFSRDNDGSIIFRNVGVTHRKHSAISQKI
jgi:hypothetical protein